MALFKQQGNIIKSLLRFWSRQYLVVAILIHTSIQKSAKGVVYIALYVDDNSVELNPEATD